MIVIDNFFPENLYTDIVAESNSPDTLWSFSRSDTDSDPYWTRYVYGSKQTSSFVFDRQWRVPLAKTAWDVTQKKLLIPSSAKLSSCYYNGLTFGNASYPHIDADANKDEKFTTIINYICPEWNIFWGGETAFFSGKWSKDPRHSTFYNSEVIKTVVPRPNRTVVFDGNVVHSVLPVTKAFTGIRVTLMFKIVGVSPQELTYIQE